MCYQHMAISEPFYTLKCAAISARCHVKAFESRQALRAHVFRVLFGCPALKPITLNGLEARHQLWDLFEFEDNCGNCPGGNHQRTVISTRYIIPATGLLDS